MKIQEILNMIKAIGFLFLFIAGSCLLAMQKEDLLLSTTSESSYPNTVQVRSHDGAFTWLLDRDALHESDVLKSYLEDSERISIKREGTILDLDSSVSNADFELFQTYLDKAWQISKNPHAFSDCSDQIIYRIAATAHYLQAPRIFHAAALEIAQRIQQPEQRKYILNNNARGIPLNDDLKKIIAQKILTSEHTWFWLHADKKQANNGYHPKIDTIAYSRLLEIYNPESIQVDSVRSRIITVFAKCAAVQGHQLSYDKKIELWDLNTRKSLKKLVLPRTGIVAIDTVGNHIAAQKEDFGVKEKFVKIWDIETKKCVHEIPLLQPDIGKLIFSPKQNMLAIHYPNHKIQVWNLTNKDSQVSCMQTFDGQEMQFDHEGKLAAIKVTAASSIDDIQIWDMQNNILLKTLPSCGSSITSYTFNPCKSIVAVGSSDGAIRLWDFIRNTLLIHRGFQAQFNALGNRMATEYGVFDTAEGTPLLYFSKPFHKFAFNEQGTIYIGHYLEERWPARYHVCDLNKNTIIIEADESDMICGSAAMELNREGNLLITKNYKQCNVYSLLDLEVYKYLKQDKTLEEALVLAHHKEIDTKSPTIRSLISGMPKSLQKSIHKQLKNQ